MKTQILCVIVLIYIYLAYNYLTNLESCSCVEGKYAENVKTSEGFIMACLLYTSPSPRDRQKSRMPSSA